MDKVKETVVLMSLNGMLAQPRATNACGPVEQLLTMYFEDNPERTPAQALEDIAALRRVRPVRGLIDSCKSLKELIPQIQEIIKSLTSVCPKTTRVAGERTRAVCSGGIISCLMSMFCPGLCPSKPGADGCACFDSICPEGGESCLDELCPAPDPNPTPATSWYVLGVDGKTAQGPYNLATLTAMIGAKQVTKDTKVAPVSSSTAWVAAGVEPTLKTLFV